MALDDNTIREIKRKKATSWKGEAESGDADCWSIFEEVQAALGAVDVGKYRAALIRDIGPRPEMKGLLRARYENHKEDFEETTMPREGDLIAFAPAELPADYEMMGVMISEKELLTIVGGKIQIVGINHPFIKNHTVGFLRLINKTESAEINNA